MSDNQPTTELITRERPLFDEARLAVASFLARYSAGTRVSYTADLRYWFAWCHEHHLDVFAVRRGHLELWARMQEDTGLARATIGRRLSTVAGFYRSAAIDGSSSTPRPSTSAAPRSTPSPRPSASTAWSCPPSSPKAPRPGRSTTRSPASSACSG